MLRLVCAISMARKLAALKSGLTASGDRRPRTFPSARSCRRPMPEMRALSQTMHAFHRDYDLLLTPTVPITAFAAGIGTPDATRFPQWFDWTPLTWPFQPAPGQPATSAPCGLSRGCRSGLQIVGPMFPKKSSCAPALFHRPGLRHRRTAGSHFVGRISRRRNPPCSRLVVP